MTKFISLLLNKSRKQWREEREPDRSCSAYTSTVWKSSKVVKGVEYSVRRASLAQRIELVKRTRELALKNDFLRAGETPDQMSAALVELYVQRLYLEWGFVEIKGFTVDGQTPTVSLLIEKGPEAICIEIAEAIQGELSLSEDERKNS